MRQISEQSIAKGKKRSRIALISALCMSLSAVAILSVLLFMHLSAHPSPSPNSDNSTDDDGFVEVDWEYWQSVNPDVIGWVTVPGTQIDHPILKASKNEPNYYLKHDVYRNYNPYGVPYLDAECEEGIFGSKNAVIYGHHMNNDSMFSDFANFIDRDYLDAHCPIYLQTPDHKAKLEVEYVDIVNGAKAEKHVLFENLTQFARWFVDARESADLVVESNSLPYQVITFCTCSYGTYANERTLVVSSDPATPDIVFAESEDIYDQAA